MNLIFLHVPKCAGTTLITALRGVYEDQLLHDMDFRQIRRRHVAWPWQCQLPLERQEMDREEVTCICGHFTWQKYQHLKWPTFVFLREPVSQVISQYSTGQNRDKAEFDWFIRKGTNSVSRMVGDLSQYFFVGLQERFDESIEMLEWCTEMTFEKPLVYRNISNGGFYRRDKYVPTAEERKLIEEVNQADIELYNQAQVIFEEQRKTYGEIKSKKEIEA